LQRLARLLNLAVVTALGIALVSCTTSDTRSAQANASESGSAATSTRSAGSANQIVEVPELASGDPAETQRLINEINRDGAPLDFTTYRESAPEAANPQGEDIVELNYEQADLRQVLQDLADAIDITLISDPSIDARVSIRTSANRPLSRDDIWPLIRFITRDNGVTLEQVGDFWAARVATSTLPTDIVTPETVGETAGNRVMQITPLTYVAPDVATEVLAPMLEENSIIKLTSRNVLAISGSASQLERVNELLTLIDADPFANQGIQLLQLRNASAEEVATELEEILALIEGPTPTYQVKGISRINAILVTAPAARGFNEIERWVRILDSENQEQVEQLFYYQVKNLSAVELAETLSNVFEEDEDEFIPATAVEPQSAEAPATDTPDVAPAPVGSATAVSANLRVRIVADEATNSLLIRSTARDYRQLLTTINQLDAVPLQVVVNAVIAQITLTADTRFGVDWSRVAANAAVNEVSTETSTSLLPPAGLGGLLFDKNFVDGSAQVDATLEAIAADNEVRLLARPTLTVTNNQEGQIQIGSDVPVEAGQSIGTGGFATTNIQYRETGIVLTLTPQINADGVVNLTIEQELSSVDNSASGVNNNPVFNSQNISTNVVVRNGESVVLGGLIQEDNQDLNTGVPGLNRIPVLGGLFSYRQDLNERRELFIVLRPEVINLNDENSLGYSEILDRFELAAELFEEAGI